MKRIVYLIILLPLLTTCEKVELDKINNLNGNKIWIIGHGGEGFQTGRHPVPTNSETSVIKAIEHHNADGVEIDVQLSKDSVIFLFHDQYLEEATHCLGCLGEMNAQELWNCRFKQDFSVNTLQNEQLVDLGRIFERYQNSVYKPQFIVDIKLSDNCGQNSNEYYDAMAFSLTGLINHYNIGEQVLISCGTLDLLKRVRQRDNSLRLIFNIGSGDFYSGMILARDNGLYGVEVNNEFVNRDLINEAHSNNLLVTIYGVKDRNTQVDAVKKSPDIIITDNIPLLQQILTN